MKLFLFLMAFSEILVTSTFSAKGSPCWLSCPEKTGSEIIYVARKRKTPRMIVATNILFT